MTRAIVCRIVAGALISWSWSFRGSKASGIVYPVPQFIWGMSVRASKTIAEGDK